MSNQERRRAWATAYIRDARERGTTPAYGSPEWHDLTPTDPLRWAAVIIAAEAWATDGDTIAERLQADLDAERRLETEEAAWFAETAASIRRRAGQPTHAQLQHRRGEITAEQADEYDRMLDDFLTGRSDVRPAL